MCSHMAIFSSNPTKGSKSFQWISFFLLFSLSCAEYMWKHKKNKDNLQSFVECWTLNNLNVGCKFPLLLLAGAQSRQYNVAINRDLISDPRQVFWMHLFVVTIAAFFALRLASDARAATEINTQFCLDCRQRPIRWWRTRGFHKNVSSISFLILIFHFLTTFFCF